MNREILFCGKRIDNGEWVYGYFLKCKTKIFICTRLAHECMDGYSNDGHFHGFEKFFEVDPETIGQYTGLTDKNGTTIFEGDIVTIDGGNVPTVIEFDDFSWACKIPTEKFYRHRLENDSQKYEVIGNIFDNSELLKGYDDIDD